MNEDLYTQPEAIWSGLANRVSPVWFEGRPELNMTLAELQAQNPFFSTPEYLDLRRQLANVATTTQQERERYIQQSQDLDQQIRGIGLLSLPQEMQQNIQNQIYQEYAQANAPAIQRLQEENNYYNDLANRVSQFLQTGKPGQRLELPRNPFSSWDQPPQFILEDPNKPYTYEERQKFHEQSLSAVPRSYLENYLNQHLATRQKQVSDNLFTLINPETIATQKQDVYNQLMSEALTGFRTTEQQRLEAQQQQLANQIRPVVDTAYAQEEALRAQINELRKAFSANQFAQQLGITPEQFMQEQNQQVAQREAQSQAQQQASQALDQQRVNYILQTGVIPTSEEQFPEELRSVNIPQVTAPQVEAPVLPQYSFLGQPPAQPVSQTLPITQPAATQPVTQPAQPAVTQPVTQQAQPVQPTQPAAQTTLPSFLGGIPVGIGGQAQPTGTTPMATTSSLNPTTLPELRSAGGGGTSAIDPTLRPYLELGLRAAEQQFLQTQPQFFPGQTYVSPSQQTLDALMAQEQLARQAPTTLQAAQESYMRGLGGLGATASGAFLSGNPYQQQMIQAATRPIMQQFEEQTLPGIASGFSGAGRYGSGAMERALGRATESTARAIGDVSTNIAFQDYGAERGRQQQAILGQITAAGQAPQIYGQQFLPSQQLAQIGAAREAIAGLPLQEQMQRFQFAQQAPRESLSAFLSSVYGTPMASSQYAPAPQTNRAANTLGLGALGAGIGSMIGGQTGAFGYTTPQLTAGGAALGALGGLLL